MNSALEIFYSVVHALFFVLSKILAFILKQGPIPKHVGIIMDGNRRFAKANKIPTKEGHLKGFQSLINMLEWCLELDIKAITVYAFSIDNYKRPQEEVVTLMEMAKEKIAELSFKNDIVKKHDIRIRVIGNLALLPEDVRVKMENINEATKNNQGPVLNICFSYSSTDEIATAMGQVVEDVRKKNIDINDVCQEEIEKNLFTSCCQDLDLLIRTSGETRLSDFLLWQTSKSAFIKFVDKYWPDFTFYDLVSVILDYQIYKLYS